MKNGSKQQVNVESHYQHLSYNAGPHMPHPSGSSTRNTLDRKQQSGGGGGGGGGDYCTQINPHYLQTFDSLDHYSVATMQQQPLRSQSKSQIYSYGSSGTASDHSNPQLHVQQQHHSLKHTKHGGKGHKSGKHSSKNGGSNSKSQDDFKAMHKQQQQSQHQHQKCNNGNKAIKRNGCSNQVLPQPPQLQQQPHYTSSSDSLPFDNNYY
ncbi:Hypothetical predicted protein [Drosophila guanche]|uniref:Uncharacterized protein n=2 Tax=Drosophila guanche TaxID=7266 RepID=A0A3B0JQE0_DROGU|nr:Hypothetical predicted protein [Drosophila guanche]